MSEQQPNIVIDNGSSFIKCGFSGEEAPKSAFKNVISLTSEKVGEESEADLMHPIEQGIIKDYERMEKIWEYTFNQELRVPSDEKNILTSDISNAPKISREKITQIFFEKFNAQGLFICIRPMLSMYCLGKTNALVVQSGDDLTQVVPIFDGYFYPYTVTKSNLAGKCINDYLIKTMTESNEILSKLPVFDINKIATDIKEKLCRISLDYDKEIEDQTKNSMLYKLPDGTEFSLEKELFKCPEVIFEPKLNGIEKPGLGLLMYNSILKCEHEQRKELYSNVVLSGGNTLLTDFPDRITLELQKLSSTSKPKVSAQGERRFTAWIGGSLIAGLSNFQQNWVTHSEYQEAGPQIIHRKCF